MAKAIVEPYNGSPAIMIDGKPYPPMLATIRTNAIDHIEADYDYFKRLGEAGIRIFFVICDTEWLKPGAFEQFRQEAETVLAAVPDAYLMLRIGLHPPLSWMKEHPDELLLREDGSRKPVELWTESYLCDMPAMYSLCSQKWREDAGKALMETYDMVEKLPYADRIIGYFLAAGGTSEWYYMGAGQGDYSEAFRRNFEEYLRETYPDEAALKRAWHDETATFAHPGLPKEEEFVFTDAVDYHIRYPKNFQPSDPPSPPPHLGSHMGTFTDMDQSKRMYDYLRAWHLGTAKSVIYFADLIKNRNKNKLVGAFYGSCGCVNYIDGSTSAGSVPVLDCGSVDFLAAPSVYQNRQLGGFAGQREPVDSFRLRNRMYIVEEDTRTDAENSYFGDLYEVFTPEDTVNIMKRDFGRDLCEDLQAWWFDQHIGGGRYGSKDTLSLIKVQQELARESYEKDRRKQNEIAFIFDEESINAVSGKTSFQAIEFMRDYEISKIGASADSYFHNDLSFPDMPSYKLYVFCNVYVLTEKERQDIKDKLKKDHAVALWLYAPGVLDPEAEPHFSTEHMRDLIGMEMTCEQKVVTPKFKINGTPHPATDALDHGQIYGYNYRYMQNNINRDMIDNTQLLYPVFYCTDEKAETLATYLQEPTMPALSFKKQDGWMSFYCGSRTLRCDALREIARFAGVHIYCDSDDVIYAGPHYITIHAASTGKKTLIFKKPCDPTEVYERKCYGRQVSEISFDMLKGETKTFALD